MTDKPDCASQCGSRLTGPAKASEQGALEPANAVAVQSRLSDCLLKPSGAVPDVTQRDYAIGQLVHRQTKKALRGAGPESYPQKINGARQLDAAGLLHRADGIGALSLDAAGAGKRGGEVNDDVGAAVRADPVEKGRRRSCSDAPVTLHIGVECRTGGTSAYCGNPEIIGLRPGAAHTPGPRW